MNSFSYDVPTRVFFGETALDKLGEEVKKYGTKLFFMYDGDYIKANGIYDAVLKAGKDYGFDIVEFTQIKPNPRHTDVQDGINLCKKEKCDVILAVGGGSTMDSAKVISSGVLLDAPIWDVIIGKVPTVGSIPLLTICTIAATGSEMNMGAVISNLETSDKQSLRRPHQTPKVTFLNPVFTYTVPKFQTACGTIDILCHTIESYFSSDNCLMLLDTFMEGIIRVVFKYGPIAYNNPTNYEARANLQWAAPWAINDLIRADKEYAWTIHPIEHEISAYTDVTHGLGLAILMPRYLRHIVDEKSIVRFRNLGERALDLDPSLSDEEMVNQVIAKIEDLAYNQLGLQSSLSQLGITDKDFEKMASKVASDNGYYTIGYRKLSKDDILKILYECL